MTVALFTAEACLLHDPGPFHPESPARLRRIAQALDAPAFAALDRREAPPAAAAQIALVHDDRYIADILSLRALAEPVALDADTIVGPGSIEAALRATGGALAAVDAVLGGQASRAFVAARPPGHHAERARAMGFCLFASAAIAARHAQVQWGLRRVAVLDFDVHHGNGTQAACWNAPGLFYASTHQWPCFPGTGAAHETGEAGAIVNVPLPPGTGGAAFLAAWTDIVLPALDRFAPELLLVSAGFDAHDADPLAQLRVQTADYGTLTAALCDRARQHCAARMVSILEGGYDLDALAESCALHVRTLLQN